MDDHQLLERITLDPEVMTGRPVIKGTRLTVGYVVNLLGHGATKDEMVEEYSRLTREDIRTCLLVSARSLTESSFMPLKAA